MARLTPKLVNTSANGSTNASSYTPITCILAPAGLVKGPKILNTVLIPNSRLTGATYFIAI